MNLALKSHEAQYFSNLSLMPSLFAFGIRVRDRKVFRTLEILKFSIHFQAGQCSTTESFDEIAVYLSEVNSDYLQESRFGSKFRNVKL